MTALSFEFGGRLESVAIDEGSVVQSGSVVARLDTSILEAEKAVLLSRRAAESAVLDRLRKGERKEIIAAALAKVRRLESEVKLAASDRKRAEKVVAGGSISRSAYDQAVALHESAGFALEEARQRLDELKAGSREEDISAQVSRVASTDAELKLLDVRLSKSTLVSPFDAICVGRFHDEGDALLPGEVVLELNESDALQARFAVPAPQLPTASQASCVHVGNQRYATGDIVQVPRVDGRSRTVDVVIPLKTAPQERVLPGMVCTLDLEKRVEADCVELPLSALVASIRGLWSCYRLHESDSDPEIYDVEKFDVTPIHTDGDRVYVVSALPDQSLVVNDGVHKLSPGMRVRLAKMHR
ncbi:putative efflux pump membrane fusion protein [Stieleria maiorica]|uniref:Putative efflux pump membrane fusion protein n=2 Tax=Stieleria maiorica TaxID=2795974 RepID=A0A5B9MJ90_9BACT|nr:putative efflux pump membrane fusion protein [Stieleria maiorica]